jgi:putative hydrolase of the HAD superfamily
LTIQKSHKVIFWDYDGTLVVDSKWSGGVLKAMDARHPGHGITHEQISVFFHEGFPWHDPDRFHPELSSSEAWWGVVRPILAGACRSIGYDRKESDRMAEIAHQVILQPGNYSLYDDTLQVLEDLKSRGWRHVILSNNFPELPEVVKKLPFGHLIDGCVTSGLAGYEKPNPGIYRYAMELAGNPEIAWMVGDNIKADVRGAEAFGLPAILVREPAKEKVRYHAKNLIEASAIILNGR